MICIPPSSTELLIPHPDYPHFYVKLLRSGKLHVNTSVKVVKNYLRQFGSYPSYFSDVLPFHKSEHVFKELLHTIMPYRRVRISVTKSVTTL